MTATHEPALIQLAPRVVFGVAVTALGLGIALHAGQQASPRPEAAAVLVGAVYLVWLLAEIPVTFRHASVRPSESRTLLPYATARIVTAASAVLWPLPWEAWSGWLILPILLLVAGIAVRQVAIWTLGRFYSHHVVRHTDHRIVDAGVYAVIRHPAYLGMLAAHVGLVAFFPNPLSVIGLVWLIAAVVRRIKVEERTLSDISGYAEYARTRKRLLPGIW